MNVKSSLACALMGLVETPLEASDVSVAMVLLWMLKKGTAQVREERLPSEPLVCLAAMTNLWDPQHGGTQKSHGNCGVDVQRSQGQGHNQKAPPSCG